MRRLVLALSFSLALLTTAPIHCADAPKPTWFVLHQDLVRPSMIQAYEQATKEVMSTLQQHHEDIPSFWLMAFAGTDLRYSYVSQAQDFVDIQTTRAGFGKLIEAVGQAKWNDLARRAGEHVMEMSEVILVEDPSLSYAPAQPRLKPEEARFFHFDLYYLQSGRDVDIEALAREFVALSQKRAVPESYRLFRVVTGSDIPLLIVMTGAKDATDFQVHDAATRELLGPEGEQLFQRAYSLCRHIDHKEAWRRPDLSLLPPAAKPAK